MQYPSLRILAANLALFLLASQANAKVEETEVLQKLQSMASDHPRLFLPKGGEVRIRQLLASNVLAAKINEAILAEADRELKTQPVARVLQGRRLLDQSRTALGRVLHLGMAWRLTGEKRYFTRAKEELIAVAQFTDWNPKHFLDVAEMTLAVAVGYDWLYPELDEGTRKLLRNAMIEKGLLASKKADSWSRATNNWNQVCNGGMTVAALAIAEHEPRLASEMIARAVNTVPISMAEFAPDGAYPEGPGYWGYGTTFNVILISALQSTLATDFGLSKRPGFLSTADYYLHVTGPSGLYFNYSDCGLGGQGVAPAMFWFAAQRKEPYLLWTEWEKLCAKSSKRASKSSDRTYPLILVWMAAQDSKPSTPPVLSWTGQGHTPVAFHRSAWNSDATFVAVKGGSASTSHAHMDIGTFVMDADGVRWADDHGMQSYNSLESRGVDLWGKGQDSGRWKVYRLGTSAHNVLMVDGAQQRIAGKAPIIAAKTGSTVIDTTSVYAGQLAKAQRGVALLSDRTVLIQDEYDTLNKTTSVRWAMLTRAAIKIEDSGKASLSLHGKRLVFQVLEPANVTLRIISTEPPADTDAPNPGTRMLGFELNNAPHSKQRIVVRLIPGSATAEQTQIRGLREW